MFEGLGEDTGVGGLGEDTGCLRGWVKTQGVLEVG